MQLPGQADRRRVLGALMHNRFAFVGSDRGRWAVTSFTNLTGDGLAPVSRIDVGASAALTADASQAWRIEGLISNLRYATRSELISLRASQEPLGRPVARCGAMIPIKKSSAWWDMAQDERRAIFEETSHHTAIGMKFLPAVARQLYHSRDLGEPFDFVTWFEFAPEHAAAFDDLLAGLRATAEWRYVEREIDIRLQLA